MDCRYVVMITDGRFFGATRGPCVGHIAPEAWAGRPLCLVQDGDVIEIDLEKRKSRVQKPVRKLKGVLAAYRAGVDGVEQGAVWLYRDDWQE